MRNKTDKIVDIRPQQGLLTRLRTDRRGNTLAMMAIALIPILGFVGSAVDTARLYMIKVRMQQACDAGALAGRKFMASGGTTLDSNATTQANTFFANNFKTGTYGVNTVSFTPSKTSDNQVAGTATATVPMTLTSILGFSTTQITVSCEARYDVADLDIMFVLDTTGSMAYAASDTNMSGQAVVSYTRSDGTTGYYNTEKSNARIKALRTAVLNFYDTLATAADSSTKIRYGFVPYTSTVNVGYVLPSSYLVAGNYLYQTRKLKGDSLGSKSLSNTYTSISQTTCNGYAGRNPSTGYTSSGTAVVKTVTWTAVGSSGNGTCYVYSQTAVPLWTYGQMAQDTTNLVTGASVTDPTELSATTRWQGCIEERDTQALSSFSQTSLPYDLDPDLAATNDATKWRPLWPDVEYDRGSTASFDSTSDYDNLNSTSNQQGGWASCPKQAQRLTTMTRTDISNYVNANDFRAIGGTYHDTGMIWGTRFINPNGPFASDTAAWSGRNPPIRHIVFMTDGEMSPNQEIYGMYGFEKLDRRVSGTASTSTLTDRHNARFLAECEAAKRRGITVWVIAFGNAMTTEEQSCASSSGNAFAASSDSQLNTAFQTIAARVAMLRISK
jgi:Flp pilus assembly protein TadG